MKIVVAKSDLENALRVVSHSVSKETDISGHYLFRAVGKKGGHNSVEVLSYNGRVFSSCPVTASFEDDNRDSFTVEAKRLDIFLGAIPDSTITFDRKEGEVAVTVSSGKSRVSFSTLDPDTYPYWDGALAGAEMTAKISAERFGAALSHGSRFVYRDEAKSPQTCSLEMRGGLLFSTDLLAVSIIKMDGMDKCGFRIFGADAKSVISFLSTFRPTNKEKTEADKAPVDSPEGVVEVWETDKALFLRRHDGATFGESKYDKRFPDMKVEWGTSDSWTVTLPKQDILNAVNVLRSGAKWEDHVMRFEIEDGKVIFRMNPANGKPWTLEAEIPVKSQTFPVKGSCDPLPEGGFSVSNLYVVALAESASEDFVTFGISPKAKWGWIRVGETRQSDNYLTTVGWLKS